MKNNKVRNLAEFRRWVKIRLVEKEISQNELATIISKDKDDNVIRKVEFWNSSLVMRFQSLNNGYLNMIAVEEHYWQDVPFVEYINNEEIRSLRSGRRNMLTLQLRNL